jgi:hypothetical protein
MPSSSESPSVTVVAYVRSLPDCSLCARLRPERPRAGRWGDHEFCTDSRSHKFRRVLMTSQAGAAAGGVASGFVTWLTQAGLGPAAVALPVNLVADKLAKETVAWFKRVRQTDDLSRLVKAASGSSVDLSRDEIKALRDLLGEEETWRLLASTDELKVAELTSQIAARLPARDGRTADDSLEAAGVIARGLMEFAVSRLAPDVFQQVVLARLGQMTSQASVLNEALFRMHKDLYHQISEASDLFQQVMDRLPPGRADLGEIRIYLAELIDWLNVDPWPSRRQSSGPVLTPAAIEHTLQIRETKQGQQDIDADELARQCSRLVILGGPGSGKTWLAKRTARRCAEQALTELADGTALDEVELPLYTTCAWLAAAPPGDSIRRATVASALSHLPDLGGARIIDALRFLFEERDAPTLLVADSLDEAPGADDRISGAGTLTRYRWRVVLTSRKSSWDNQLTIEEANPSHCVAELQPLDYPSDVEAIIQHWFADTPERGQALAAQIAQRPSLQQAATVPLILAFYCILGADQLLPEFRHKLHEQIVNRMLRSPWHPSSGSVRDVEACRAALRTWAWRGAKSDQISGVGVWDDDIPTEDAQLSAAGQVAVDNIATPLRSPGFDTDETVRRFVHRSIREYLVAEHVARLRPADQAVEELLPHLWYDPAWGYTAPAAIAMHSEHDELLRILLRRVSRKGEIPVDLAADDTGNEVREVLAHVAAESKETDWSPDTATVIGQARVGLARSVVFIEAAGWPTSNSQIRQIALKRMAEDVDSLETARWALALAKLNLAPGDKSLASEAVLEQLRTETHGWRARDLAGTLARLEPAPADQLRAREVLLARLGASPCAPDLAAGLLLLEPSPDDKRRALATMLTQLADPDYRLTDWYGARYLMYVSMPDVLVQLGPTAEDIGRARDALFERLGRERDGTMAVRLIDILIRLDPAPQGRHEVLNAGLQLLLVADQHLVFSAGPLPETVMSLAQSAEEKHRALDTLIKYLSGRLTMKQAADLAPLAAQLDPTPEDKRRARQVLLGLLTAPRESVLRATKSARNLVAAFLRLDPEPDEVRQAWLTILGLLRQAALEGQRERPLSDRVGRFSGFSGQNYSAMAADLAAALLQLDPSAEAKRQARYDLLGLLTNQDRSGETTDQADLAAMLGKLDPESSDKGQACGALLALLARNTRGMDVKKLAEAMAQLDPTPSDKDQARRILHNLLRGQAVHSADKIMAGLTLLDATPDDLCQTRKAARDALLAHIGTGDFPTFGTVAKDVNVLAQLASTPKDKRQTLDGLLGLLARERDSDVARDLIGGIAQLDPTVHDLSSWPTWAASPSRELLAAARRNSALHEWLTIISL